MVRARINGPLHNILSLRYDSFPHSSPISNVLSHTRARNNTTTLNMAPYHCCCGAVFNKFAAWRSACRHIIPISSIFFLYFAAQLFSDNQQTHTQHTITHTLYAHRTQLLLLKIDYLFGCPLKMNNRNIRHTAVEQTENTVPEVGHEKQVKCSLHRDLCNDCSNCYTVRPRRSWTASHPTLPYFHTPSPHISLLP